jgi:hypothetical protein
MHRCFFSALPVAKVGYCREKFASNLQKELHQKHLRTTVINGPVRDRPKRVGKGYQIHEKKW